MVFFTILLIIWEVAYRLAIWPDFLFPSPTQVAKTLINGFVSGSYPLAFLHSFRRLLIGYFLALILGLSLGALLLASKSAEQTLGMLVIAFQSVPSVVWLPLALLWFKMGEASIIFVVVIGGIWNMVVNTQIGIKTIDPILHDAGRVLGYRGFNLFRHVTVPAAIPALVTGMRLSWAFCWRALMAGEILGTGKGLGQILMWGRDMGNMKTVLSIMFLIALTGIITDHIIFNPIENNLLRRWGKIQ